MNWLTVIEYLCHKWPRIYVPLDISTLWFFPHLWLITGFGTRLARRVTLVEQELPTLPEHKSSPSVFSRVRVTRSLVLCVCFVDGCLSCCPFSFIYGFWLPLWYLQALHTEQINIFNITAKYPTKCFPILLFFYLKK